jgi:hypothetical protein
MTIHIGNHKIPICYWNRNNVKVFLLEISQTEPKNSIFMDDTTISTNGM